MKSVVSIIIVVTCVGVVLGDVPDKMAYQGRLLDNLGDPVADGVYSVTFTIYDDSTGGSPLWTEMQNVTTENGLFSVQLGASMPLDAALFSGLPRFLGVQVGGDPELSPRTRLATVPYAFQAASAQSAMSGAFPVPHTHWVCPIFSSARVDLNPDVTFTLIRILNTDTLSNLVTLTFYDNSGLFIDQCSKSLSPLEIWTWSSDNATDCPNAAPAGQVVSGSFAINAQGPVAPWGVLAIEGGVASATSDPYSAVLLFYAHEVPIPPTK